jgi:hypothetical protein
LNGAREDSLIGGDMNGWDSRYRVDDSMSEESQFLGVMLNQVDQDDSMTALFVNAVRRLSTSGEMADRYFDLLVAEGKEPDPDRHELRKREIALAEQEATAGYPNLLRLAVVAVYGALETTVRGYVARMIAARHKWVDPSAFGKIRLRIADYYEASQVEHAYSVLDAYESERGTRRAGGVKRFDALLRIVGLQPTHDADLRRKIRELESLRHLYAHGHRTTDAKFCDECPWLGLKPGDPVAVDLKKYASLRGGVTEYLTGLMEAAATRLRSKE